ncbi:MAG: hypothetical protein AAFQ59_07815 [Pseudomonadota bacterium]
MTVLRTWAKVEAFDGGPTDTETELIKACKAGERYEIGRGTLPGTATPENTIRADILRYLILGGCEDCPVDLRGVWLVGGFITGPLNLDFATAHGATQLQNCTLSHALASGQTHFKMVNLSGSGMPGWAAHGARIDGNLFIGKVVSPRTIDLSGSHVGGQLSCVDARLTATTGHALKAHSAKIEGHVMLRKTHASGTINLVGSSIEGQLNLESAVLSCTGPYAILASDTRIDGGVFLHPRTQEEKDKVKTPFHCTGEIRLNGATIGGLYAQQTTLVAGSTGQSLSLGGATVNGPVRLDGCDSTGELLIAGSRISGRLTCERMVLQNENGHAFNGQAIRVDHSFVWKKVNHVAGAVSLNGAHVAELDDHPDNWPDSDALFMDGFTYDRIKGTVSTSPERMDWLKAGSFFGIEFRPQPYSQYAKFLRDTGHDEDARHVLYMREKLRRASARNQLSASGHSFAVPLNIWARFWDILLRWVVGYGHYPFNSVAVLAVLICCAIVPAHYAWEEGSLAPNAGPLLVSAEWTSLARVETHPAAIWTGDRLPSGETDLTLAAWKEAAPGRDWETFNRYAYGFDVVIPIIDFGQTDAWAPSTTRGPVGWHLWWARWVLSVMGWIVTALGAAAITGIIRRE